MFIYITMGLQIGVTVNLLIAIFIGIDLKINSTFETELMEKSITKTNIIFLLLLIGNHFLFLLLLLFRIVHLVTEVTNLKIIISFE